MVLGKLPGLGRPTNLDNSRARGLLSLQQVWVGVVWIFFSHLSFLSSFALSLGDSSI